MTYGLDVDQFRLDIIRPVLTRIGLHSQAAENLVLGTALHESHLKYVRQIRGPALGPFQMEPATHYDLHWNFLAHHRELRAAVVRYAANVATIPDPGEMVGNWFYAAAMCRVHYRRIKAALPSNDPQALAQYWKAYYNTRLGKGTVEQALPHFMRACA